jgi:hypothetical protein
MSESVFIDVILLLSNCVIRGILYNWRITMIALQCSRV